jgi:hypothetical protein
MRRLLRRMGWEAVYLKPRLLSVPGEGVTRYRYRLRERVVTAPTKRGAPTSLSTVSKVNEQFIHSYLLIINDKACSL